MKQMPNNRDHDRSGSPTRVAALLSRTDTHPLPVLCLIVVLALALAVPSLVLNPITRNSGQTVTWWPIIDNVEDGRGYTGCLSAYFPFCSRTNDVTAAREPAPVLLFAGIARLTPDSFRTLMFVQIALNLAIVVAVYLLGCELANRRIGLVAALFWSLYLPPNRTEITQLTGNLLATLFVTFGLLCFLRAWRTRSTADWLAAGACLGFSAISRSAMSIIAPVLLFGVLIATLRKSPVSLKLLWRSLYPIGLSAVVFASILCPWLIRNWIAFDRPVLGSTLTGYDLYRQNFLLSTGNYLHFVASAQAGDGIGELLARRTDLTGTETEAQMDVVYRQEAIAIIKAHPSRYFRLSLARVLMLWFDWSVSKAYGHSYILSDYLVWCQQALFLLAACLGTWVLRWRAWPLVTSVLAITLVYMLVIGRLYLLIPVMPLVVALSAIGCMLIWRRGHDLLRDLHLLVPLSEVHE